eukprot:scaffold877_cov154-Amphora_coffeaeformis.AAC.1
MKFIPFLLATASIQGILSYRPTNISELSITGWWTECKEKATCGGTLVLTSSPVEIDWTGQTGCVNPVDYISLGGILFIGSDRATGMGIWSTNSCSKMDTPIFLEIVTRMVFVPAKASNTSLPNVERVHECHRKYLPRVLVGGARIFLWVGKC